MRLQNFLWVGLGGAVGGGLRHGLSLVPGASYPAIIFCINIIGAFVLPLIAQYVLPKFGASTRAQLFVTTGAISAFTTFSAITGEMVERIHDGQAIWAFIYLAVTLLLGLLAAAFGVHLAQRWAAATAIPGDNPDFGRNRTPRDPNGGNQ